MRRRRRVQRFVAPDYATRLILYTRVSVLGMSGKYRLDTRLGGGGMADPDNEVRGGGGMAEQVSVVLGGGGINDPERAWLSALARTTCPASTIASPSSSPAAPDSMPSILQRIR